MYDYAIKVLQDALDNTNLEINKEFKGRSAEYVLEGGIMDRFQDICDLEDAISTLKSIAKEFGE
jgi:hypothetical protein